MKTAIDSTSLKDVRWQFQQVQASAKDARRFEKMSSQELANYAFAQEMEGFKARHHLWNRMAQRCAKN